MKLTASIVANVASNAAGNALCEAIGKLCDCAVPAAVAAVIGTTAMPLLIPAVALVGAELLLSRSERKDAAAFDAHCAEVMRLVRQIDQNADRATEALDDIVQHKSWVWARLSGSDQAAFARRVSGEVLKKLNEHHLATDDKIDGLLIYSETVLSKLDTLQTSFDAIARTIIDKYERSERDLRSMLDGRDQQIATLTASLEEARRAADAGDADAERAIRVARATGDAELLQKTIARLARAARQQQLARRSQEDEIYITRAREVADIAYLRGEIDEALYWLNEIIALRPKDLDAINRVGWVYQLRGELPAAEKQYCRLIELDASDEWHAITLGNLGLIAYTRGDLDTAEKFHRESLEINSNVGSLEGQAGQLCNLGMIAQARNDLKAAEYLYRKSLEIFQKLGVLGQQAIILGNLGVIAKYRDDLDAAEKLHREALEIDRKLSRLGGQAANLGNLGLIIRRRGDLGAAEKLHREALEINSKLGRPEGQAKQLCNLGLIAQTRGDLDAAEKLHCEALEFDRKLGRLEGQALNLGNLGLVAAQRKDFAEARRLSTQSRDLYAKVGMPHKVKQLQGWLDELPPG